MRYTDRDTPVTEERAPCRQCGGADALDIVTALILMAVVAVPALIFWLVTR